MDAMSLGFVGGLAFSNIGLPGTAIRGSRWFSTHRLRLRKMFVDLLQHSDDIIGLCLCEVGNLADFVCDEGKKRIEDVLHDAFVAARKQCPVQIYWAGETLTAWVNSVSVTKLLPMERMEGLQYYRRVERFEVHGVTACGECSLLVYNQHQAVSEGRPFSLANRTRFCRYVMDDAIRTCEDKPSCVGFLFGGDANCGVDIWRPIHSSDREMWRELFQEPEYIFASVEKMRKPQPGDVDIAVGMGIAGLNFEQQHSAAPGREKIHDNVVVRWAYCPAASGTQCYSGAPPYDEFAPASGTRERRRCLGAGRVGRMVPGSNRRGASCGSVDHGCSSLSARVVPAFSLSSGSTASTPPWRGRSRVRSVVSSSVEPCCKRHIEAPLLRVADNLETVPGPPWRVDSMVRSVASSSVEPCCQRHIEAPLHRVADNLDIVSGLRDVFAGEIECMSKVLGGPIEESRFSVRACPEIPAVITGGPSRLLRVALDDLFEIAPRLCRGAKDIWENALNPDGTPLTSFHGTYGSFAVRILQDRVFRMGTVTTGGWCGVWHGHMQYACKYALPYIWPECHGRTMTIFELQVTALSSRAVGRYCTRFPGCFQVVALLLGRVDQTTVGSSLESLGFCEVGNGTECDPARITATAPSRILECEHPRSSHSVTGDLSVGVAVGRAKLVRLARGKVHAADECARGNPMVNGVLSPALITAVAPSRILKRGYPRISCSVTGDLSVGVSVGCAKLVRDPRARVHAAGGRVHGTPMVDDVLPPKSSCVDSSLQTRFLGKRWRNGGGRDGGGRDCKEGRHTVKNANRKRKKAAKAVARGEWTRSEKRERVRRGIFVDF